MREEAARQNEVTTVRLTEEINWESIKKMHCISKSDSHQ